VACAPSSSPAQPASPSTPASARPASGAPAGSVSVVRLPDAEPAEREAAAIETAFDPMSASALASALPADLEWATTGVICVYLGRRAEGGWALAIQSASLADGELQVLARETRPIAGVDRPGPTFPADCATIDRGALPAGTLPARAHDTVSDEFIVAGELVIPAP
jgi:hypothetical protein